MFSSVNTNFWFTFQPKNSTGLADLLQRDLTGPIIYWPRPTDPHLKKVLEEIADCFQKLLILSSWCFAIVVWLFLTVSCDCGISWSYSHSISEYMHIVSAGKYFLNTNLSDLSNVGTCDIFVYPMRHQIMWSTRLVNSKLLSICVITRHWNNFLDPKMFCLFGLFVLIL